MARTTPGALDRAREAYQRWAWADAYARFAAADRRSPLEPEDLERLATAAYLLGRGQDSADGWARAPTTSCCAGATRSGRRGAPCGWPPS